MMLESAEKFESAFDLMHQSPQYSSFRDYLDSKKGLPSSEDWQSIRRLMKYLKFFCELIIRVSGSSYV
ncbi:unnamed protein product, partial [Linum tenue]